MQQPDNLHDEVKKLCKNGHDDGEEEEQDDTDARIAALRRRIKGGSKLRLKRKRKN
jgi:hypothetical protein